MKITNLHLVSLRNAEHFQLMSETNDLVIRYTPAAIDVVDESAAFFTAFAEEDTSFKILSKSALTAELKLKDAVRDSVDRGMRVITKALSKYHYDEAVRMAAYRVTVLLDGYGKIASMGYDRETAAILNIAQDLRSDKYAADVQAIGMTDWVDKLEAANQDFAAVMKERYSEQSEKNMLTRMQTARAATDKAYREMCNKINSGVIFLGPDKYEGFINDMNVRINRFKTIVAQRRGRSSSKSEGNAEA